MPRLRDIRTSSFQESITNELLATKDRVRSLIGDAHRWEDGRYKEVILKKIINNYLPQNLSIGTGFILSDIEIWRANVSSQIDIIIYDNTYPLLFKEWDFIITTKECVKWIIEVKTKVTNTNIRDICSNLNELFEFIDEECFNWLFSFEYDGDINSDQLESSLQDSMGKINHICLGSKYFIKYWLWDRNIETWRPLNEAHQWPFYNIYDLNNLALSYFISNLIHCVSAKNLSSWSKYSFPIEEWKENHRIKSIYPL